VLIYCDQMKIEKSLTMCNKILSCGAFLTSLDTLPTAANGLLFKWVVKQANEDPIIVLIHFLHQPHGLLFKWLVVTGNMIKSKHFLLTINKSGPLFQ
jgi:hypothetical protein